MSWFRENVARIRPEYQVADPVDVLDHPAGEQVQCDLTFVPGGIPDEQGQPADLPVLVMVSSFSRFMAARVLPSRRTPDLVAGMWEILSAWQVVPDHLLWDREAGIGQKRLTDQVLGFAGTLGVKIKQAPPFDPETKGVVERTNGYLKSSFLPGRQFKDPADFQNQLDDWLATVANQRVHATTKQVPAQAWEQDRAAMRGLPPFTPTVGVMEQIRLPRNYYVVLDTNKYSVDPTMINRMVTIHADLHTVMVTGPGGVVVGRDHRVWGKHQVITDPAHVAAARMLRHQRHTAPPPTAPAQVVVQAPDLGVYGALTGWGETA